MFRIAATISLLLSACGAYSEIGKPTPLAYSGVTWADQAAEGAVRFWAAHGERFDLGDTTGYSVNVTPLPTDRVGQCGEQTIDLSPSLDGHAQKARCVLAHELGHLIGMTHVAQSESLMAPVLAMPADATRCYWSSLDQNELEAALQRGRSACP